MLSELKIILVGCGKMGTAMLEGWLNRGVDPKNLLIVDPHASEEDFAKLGVSVIRKSSEIEGFKANICLFAVKPQIIGDVLGEYKNYLDENKNCVILSIIAGTKVERFAEDLGADSKIVRLMPNLPVTVSEGVIGYYANDNISNEEKVIINSLFSSIARVFEVKNETQIDSITAISGSGPAYIFYLIECFYQAALDVGLGEDIAYDVAVQTVYGSSKMALESELDASVLRKNVTSPNGTTQAGLDVLMNNSTTLKQLLHDTANGAKNRSIELSNNN